MVRGRVRPLVRLLFALVSVALLLVAWRAEADPAKIADATTDDYDFHDPLVGGGIARFVRWERY